MCKQKFLGSRMVELLRLTWNQTEFVLLPLKAKYTELYMRSIHDMNHAGVEYILATIRCNRWIPGARIFLKLVARQCAI
jgi:2-iminoacetate synthase ThiH